MTEWQPIETATIQPFSQVNWYRSASPYLLLYPGPHIGCYAYTKRGKGRWTAWHGIITPTHWMPLPADPDEEAAT